MNRDKSQDRSAQPVVKRDTRHELKHGLVGRRSSNARQLGCVFQDVMLSKSLLRKSTDMQRPIQRVKFAKALARHTEIRDQNHSLGHLPRRREWQERWAAKQRGSWPEVCLNYRSIKEQHSSHLWKRGACLHQLLNLRNESMLWTPERRCI